MFGLTRDERERALARLDHFGEPVLTALSLLLVVLLTAPLVTPLAPETVRLFGAIELAIWIVFALTLAVRTILSTRRLPYLLQHWLGIAMVALPPLPLLWAAAAVARSIVGMRRIFAVKGLGYLLAAGALVVAVGAVMVLEVERQSAFRTIRSLDDAVWWAISTVTTVGYGDYYPTTSAGRGVGIALMLLGIALFGAATARMAAYFVGGAEDARMRETRELLHRLDRIERRLAVLVGDDELDGACPPGTDRRAAAPTAPDQGNGRTSAPVSAERTAGTAPPSPPA